MRSLIFIIFLSQIAFAQEPTTAEIKQQLDELSEKLKNLENKKEEKSKVSFFGDFRLRHQAETTGTFEERRIQRLQLKLGAKIEFNESLQLFARLLTGSSANSGNVTMGDNKSAADSRRSIGVDWAYFNYKPYDFLIIQGGKLPTPFYFVGKNQLILDRDITPEGWAIKVPVEISDEWSFAASGLGSWAVESYDSASGLDEVDSFFNGAQAYARWKKNDLSIIAGAGTFSFTKVKGSEPRKFFGNSSDVSLNSGRGNTLVLDTFSGLSTYQYNYDLSETFIEAKYKMKDWEFSVFQENVENYSASLLNKASSMGFTAQYKKWNFSFMDQKIEKDSVFALFTDSDFAGNLTSSKGNVWQLSYKVSSETVVTYTQFDNKIEIDTTTARDYTRSHLDLTFSF